MGQSASVCMQDAARPQGYQPGYSAHAARPPVLSDVVRPSIISDDNGIWKNELPQSSSHLSVDAMKYPSLDSGADAAYALHSMGNIGYTSVSGHASKCGSFLSDHNHAPSDVGLYGNPYAAAEAPPRALSSLGHIDQLPLPLDSAGSDAVFASGRSASRHDPYALTSDIRTQSRDDIAELMHNHGSATAAARACAQPASIAGHYSRRDSFASDKSAVSCNAAWPPPYTDVGHDIHVTAAQKGLPYPPAEINIQVLSKSPSSYSGFDVLSTDGHSTSTMLQCEDESRDSWDVGWVVEAYSATANCWYPARVMQVQPGGDRVDVLTVQFYLNDEAKQKSMYRGDAQLAPLGAHTRGELPPGFQTRPSQSRPGQVVYMDATTAVKYASPQLAWRVHFERLLQSASAEGLETVCNVKSCLAGPAPPPPHMPSPAAPASSEPASRALTLAELQRREPAGGAPDTALGGPKIPLPFLGDAMGSQAAYLGYVAKSGCGGAPDAEPAEAPRAPPAHRALPAPLAPRRPARSCNPALQTWQEDPFSEWRAAQ